MFPSVMNKRANLLLLALALLFCHVAYGISPVRTLFNPSNFIAEDGAMLSEKFWSTPSSKLYDKLVTQWEDEDFDALDIELRRSVYLLSLSNNPFRHAQVDRLQQAVDLVPSFRLWAKHAKEGVPPPEEGFKAAGPDAPKAAEKPDGKPSLMMRLAVKMRDMLLPKWITQSEYWKKFIGYAAKYVFPYLLPVFLASLFLGTVGGSWYFVHKRITVPYCPKCKNKDKKKLRVGTRTFRSIFRRGKRK